MPRGDQLARQWRLLESLGRPQGLPIEDAARRLGCTVRTVWRDLHALQDAGFPIYELPGGFPPDPWAAVGAGPLDVNFRGLIDPGGAVRLVTDDTRWTCWARYSGRQDRRIEWDGLVGTAVYEGDVKPFWPYLLFGQWTHVGSDTTFGLGAYRIALAGDLSSMTAAGRNYPCPCGSGRKFKRCCLGKAATPDGAFTTDERRSALDRLSQFARGGNSKRRIASPARCSGPTGVRVARTMSGVRR